MYKPPLSVLAGCILSCFSMVSNTVFADENGSAEVTLNFSGNVLAAPCQITTTKPDLALNFKDLPASVGIKDSDSQTIDIDFTGCPNEPKQLTMTLSGETSEAVTDGLKINPTATSKFFKDNGLTAKDIGIVFMNDNNDRIKLGEPMDLTLSNPETGEGSVHLVTKVAGNGKNNAGVGTFTATATMSIAYQ